MTFITKFYYSTLNSSLHTINEKKTHLLIKFMEEFNKVYMKVSQWVMLGFFIVLSGGIFLILKSNQKEEVEKSKDKISEIFVPIRKVVNSTQSVSLTSYGQVASNIELLVSFEVQGKLEKGALTLKPGSSFRKGQKLYQVNNIEAAYTLTARKSTLSNLILSSMPDIELDYPSERDKWASFLNDIDPLKNLPQLPKTNSSKEKMFITSRNIFAEYYNLRSLESRMEKYFWIAPFNGTIISTFAEPGAIVNPGTQVAKIIKTGAFEVKVPISTNDIELYKGKGKANFLNSEGLQIGTGKILRVSNVINQQTQANDVYYSIVPTNGMKVYSGMFVNVSIDQFSEKSTMTLPRAAIKNNQVYILKGDKIVMQDILISGSKQDSVFVTGLNTNQQVILEQVEMEDGISYKGIIR